jgi:hypothetical protein
MASGISRRLQSHTWNPEFLQRTPDRTIVITQPSNHKIASSQEILLYIYNLRSPGEKSAQLI